MCLDHHVGYRDQAVCAGGPHRVRWDEPPATGLGAVVIVIHAVESGYDSRVRMAVEGTTYRADDANTNPNMYILDVAPEPPDSGGPLKWDLTQDLDKHATPVSGRVRTWGANDHPNHEFAELLYLKDQIIEVTDGKLTVYGGDIDSGGYILNFLEVVKMPIPDCDDVWDSGFGLISDLNKDCYVDMQDLAKMFLDWAKCYDPNDLDNCPLPEEW